MLTRLGAGSAWRFAAALLLGCAALAATTAIAFALHTRLMVVSLVYVVIIALVSMTGEVVVCVALALFAAVCLIYFFLPPIFSFAIGNPTDVFALIVFVATALLVTHLVNRARRVAEAAALQEARLNEAQRIANVGWWERDFRTNHVSLSEEVCRIFGLQPVDLPDWHERWLALIHPEDRSKSAEASAAALAGGPRYDAEYRIVRPDGTVRVVHSQGDVTWDETGRPLRQFGVLQDITELRQAERELRASEARFRTFVDYATDSFFLLDDQLTVLDVNSQAADSLGYSREELIGMHPRDVDVDQDKADIERIRQSVTTGEKLTFETRHRRKDGTVFPVEIRVGHFEQEGRRFLALARDITERKRAEESLHQMQSELAHANRVATMGQLTASISHEVAQPVAASITNATAALRWLAADPPDLDEVRAALDRILRNGKRASEVIGRIRALVRREAPRSDRFDINEMIREVIVLTQGELGRNGISLNTELAQGLPIVAGDRIQLQQVILNLILNAVEATAGHSEHPPYLLISTQPDDAGGLRISVCDSGPGFAPNSTPLLFEAFYTTKPGGMGMGLSICRSIVEAHGGRIWAEPNEPHGAVVRLTLPREQGKL